MRLPFISWSCISKNLTMFSLWTPGKNSFLLWAGGGGVSLVEHTQKGSEHFKKHSRLCFSPQKRPSLKGNYFIRILCDRRKTSWTTWHSVCLITTGEEDKNAEKCFWRPQSRDRYIKAAWGLITSIKHYNTTHPQNPASHQPNFSTEQRPAIERDARQAPFKLFLRKLETIGEVKNTKTQKQKSRENCFVLWHSYRNIRHSLVPHQVNIILHTKSLSPYHLMYYVQILAKINKTILCATQVEIHPFAT